MSVMKGMKISQPCVYTKQEALRCWFADSKQHKKIKKEKINTFIVNNIAQNNVQK